MPIFQPSYLGTNFDADGKFDHRVSSGRSPSTDPSSSRRIVRRPAYPCETRALRAAYQPQEQPMAHISRVRNRRGSLAGAALTAIGICWVFTYRASAEAP